MEKQPATLKFNKCKCNWGKRCSETQERIAKYCFETGKSHPCLGYLHMTEKQVNLRASVRKYLGKGFGEASKNYFIARHHFHPYLVTLHGNKAMTVKIGNGSCKVIDEIEGKPGWKKADKLMTPEEGHLFSIQDRREWVAADN